MILLLGFSADQSGQGDAEFQVTDTDALRVLKALGEERAFHRGVTVIVTILNEALTHEVRSDNITGTGGDPDALDLFSGR